MDPFGDNDAELNSFQAPADASAYSNEYDSLLSLSARVWLVFERLGDMDLLVVEELRVWFCAWTLSGETGDALRYSSQHARLADLVYVICVLYSFYEVDSGEATAPAATDGEAFGYGAEAPAATDFNASYGSDATFQPEPAQDDHASYSEQTANSSSRTASFEQQQQTLSSSRTASFEQQQQLSSSRNSSFKGSNSRTSSFGQSGAQIPVIEEENELTKFMRVYEQQIAEKAVDQEKVAHESKDKAKADMDKFVAERSRIKESKQEANRVHEQATLEKLAADLEGDNPWERVVSLVELEANRKQKLAALNAKKDSKAKEVEAPKPAKKDEDEEDVSRMRQLFVQLKAEPLEKTRGIASH